MFDFCKFKNRECPYSYKGQICGFVLGKNLISELKKCPLLLHQQKTENNKRLSITNRKYEPKNKFFVYNT